MPLSRHGNYSFSGATLALTKGKVTLTPSLFALASTHGGLAVLPTVAVAWQPTLKRVAAAKIVITNFLFMLRIFYNLPTGVATLFFHSMCISTAPLYIIEIVSKFFRKTISRFRSFSSFHNANSVGV